MQNWLEEDIKKINLEKKIALTIARIMKETTGKGPTNYKSYLTKDLFVLRIRGFLCAGEVLLSQTEQGRDKIRQFRLELTKAINQIVKQDIKTLLGNEPRNVFFDVDVETNEGIIVLTFSEDLNAGTSQK